MTGKTELIGRTPQAVFNLRREGQLLTNTTMAKAVVTRFLERRSFAGA
jgi:hypothetical protein